MRTITVDDDTGELPESGSVYTEAAFEAMQQYKLDNTELFEGAHLDFRKDSTYQQFKNFNDRNGSKVNFRTNSLVSSKPSALQTNSQLSMKPSSLASTKPALLNFMNSNSQLNVPCSTSNVNNTG